MTLPDCSHPPPFAARFEELARLLGEVRAACARAGFSAEFTRRVELVLEEIFSNTVRHGGPGVGVWLVVDPQPGHLHLVYADDGPGFDPLADAGIPEAGRIGGVGRMLIRRMPDAVDYARIDGRNTLTLEFRQPA